MYSITHNSHNLFYRNPFGAVVCGTQIRLRLTVITDPNNRVDCKLQVFENQKPIQINMIKEESNEEKITFVQTYSVPQKPGLVWYYFVVTINDETILYGDNWERLGGEGIISNENTPAYQITVYKDSIRVPRWFKESIMYQIFVDRFFNGNEDGKILTSPKGSLLHGDWYDTPYYIRDKNDSVVRWDFFGGNLKGITKKLPYLKELGIGVIYLNPVFEAASNHKYDTGDYKKIDSMFGTIEDFNLMIIEGEKLGIRFILDGVFSHTGSDSKYFNKDGKYDELGAWQSKDSKYYKWFKFTNYPEEYESWWGVGTLPNVNEMEPSYQDYIYKDRDSVIQYWAQEGVKGWRLDVADELPDDFIKGLKKSMKEADEESVLIGEVWEDASNKVSYEVLREYFWGEELDSVMNYPFRAVLIDFVLAYISGEKAYKKLMSLYENYPKEIFYSTVNLIGTHDVERILTILGEAQNANDLTYEQREKYRLSDEKKQLGIKRLKLISLIQMTFPGVPCIYYGDEAGLQGYSDPYNRGTYPWDKEEKELLDWYKKITSIRNKHKVFVTGEWVGFNCKDDLFGYIRTLGKERAICIFNRSLEKNIALSLDDELKSSIDMIDLLNNNNKISSKKIELKPLEGRIFLINE